MKTSAGSSHRVSFHTIREAYTVLAFSRDEHGRATDAEYVAANSAFRDLCAIPCDGLLGRSVSELFPKTELTFIPRLDELPFPHGSAYFEYYSDDQRPNDLGLVDIDHVVVEDHLESTESNGQGFHGGLR
jgi:hypothetical protein